MVNYIAILIVGFALLILYHDPKKEKNMTNPKPLEKRKYNIGDLVKMAWNDAICIYLDCHVSQELAKAEDGTMKPRDVYYHRVVDLRDTRNPIDCMDFEITPYQTAKYSPYEKEITDGKKS